MVRFLLGITLLVSGFHHRSLGDEFFDTNSDILYKRINDGSTDAWLDISTDSTLTVSYITDMTDVETGATNGQVLKWNSTTSKWSPSTDTNTDTVYTHPTTAGNKHIPTGGSAGQVLKYSASGTAVWASDDAGILQDLSTVTVGTTITNLDLWNKTSFVSAKYTATCKVGSKYSVSEILILNKGGSSVEITEYGNLGDSIITFTADITSVNVRLRAVSTDGGTSVKLTKVLQGV